MPDIGDGDQQPPAALLIGLAVDGIIEIARIGAVHGHQRNAAQIDAAGLVAIFHARAEAGAGRFHRIGPARGNAVAADGDLDFHARRHVLAQHLADPAQRRAALARRLDDVGHHDLVVLHLALPVGGNDDLVGDAGILGQDEADAALAVEATHHLLGVALQHLDHHAFPAAAAVLAANAHQHPVAVEQFAHLPRGEKDVVARVFRHQETEAVAMRDDASAHQVHAVDQAVGTLAVDGQLAVPDHGGQPPLHTFQGLGPRDRPRSTIASRLSGSPASVSSIRRYSRLGAGCGYFSRSCS